MRRTTAILVAPWVPRAMGDTMFTVPPPVSGEAGGLPGVSVPYSGRIAKTAHWKRMAATSYEERMVENATYYPFIGANSNEYSQKYLPRPYPDPIRNRPLYEVGESRAKLPIRVPVIFLVNLFNNKTESYIGKRFETVYVSSNFMREQLLPQRYAVYATTEAYRLLGLPVVDHKMHTQIPKNAADLRKHAEKKMWDEERWKYTVDYLFRSYENGPAELLDIEEEWDGHEELGGLGGATGGGEGAGRSGPIKVRKARKIKLF